MENIEIIQTNTSKFLPVLIDDNLSWKKHIDYITKKVAKSVGIIKRIHYKLAINALKTLYNTLILPYLNYWNIIWAINNVTRLKPLLMQQKKDVRINTASPYNSHAFPLFAKLNQFTVFDLNQLATSTFMFRSGVTRVKGQSGQLTNKQLGT